MARRRLLAGTVVVAMIGALGATTIASANSDSVDSSPLTCTTSPDLGNQTAKWTSTVSDDHDPAAVGDTMTYRFVVPFAQDPPPVTANYRGGTIHYKIPAGFTVASVRTENPAGGSPITSTAAVQIPSTYPYDQQVPIENVAAFYSIDGDQLHVVGALILVYLDAISPR
jgi:hypothetical protein